MRCFYWGITGWITAWYRGSTASGQKTLQGLVQPAKSLLSSVLSNRLYLSCLTHMRTPSTPHTPSSASCPQGEGAGVSGPGASPSVPLLLDCTLHKTKQKGYCTWSASAAIIISFFMLHICLILKILFFYSSYCYFYSSSFVFLVTEEEKRHLRSTACPLHKTEIDNKNLCIFHMWMIERAVKHQKSLFSSLKLL